MKLLHAIDTGGPGGAETVFAALAGGLDPARFPPVAAVGSDRWLAARLRNCGVAPVVVPSRGAFNLRYLLRLVRLIRRERVQLVHSHLFGSNVYASLAGLICRVPVVCTFHGDVDIRPGDRLLTLKLRLLRAGADAIVCVSEGLARRFAEQGFFPPGRTTVIHNGVDTTRFHPARNRALRDELGVEENELLIGAVGNLRAPKGYDHLIRAAARLRDRGLRFRIAIAGEGRDPLRAALMGLIAELELGERVHLLGFRDDTVRLLNGLDLFVLPSTSEGFSIATVEAMACALPVVATRSGGPEEIVTDGVDGRLVEPGSAEALAQGLGELMEHPDRRSALAARARDTAVGRFSLAAMREGYAALYERLGGEKTEGPGVTRRVHPHRPKSGAEAGSAGEG